MTQLFVCILVIGSSVHCSVKRHDGPPLFIRDIYTDGVPDAGRPTLLKNIKKNYPLLNEIEIIDCIEFCGKSKDPNCDIIAEVQELQLWKSTHLTEIKDKQSCFEEYKRRRD